MVHMSVDNDEKLEKTCGKCKKRMEEHRCQSCGEGIFDELETLNPNFDEEMFNKLKKETT